MGTSMRCMHLITTIVDNRFRIVFGRFRTKNDTIIDSILSTNERHNKHMNDARWIFRHSARDSKFWC